MNENTPRSGSKITVALFSAALMAGFVMYADHRSKTMSSHIHRSDTYAPDAVVSGTKSLILIDLPASQGAAEPASETNDSQSSSPARFELGPVAGLSHPQVQPDTFHPPRHVIASSKFGAIFTPSPEQPPLRITLEAKIQASPPSLQTLQEPTDFFRPVEITPTRQTP